VAYRESGSHRLDGQTWTRVELADRPAAARVVNAGTFEDGTVWAGTTTGLFVRADGSNTFRRATSDWAWAATEDHARTVWITDD
jgi:hypothetical protein